MKIIIGIDFDNTIVCYHDIFHKVAVEKRLIDIHFPKNKEKVRDFLREQGQEDVWTELQGYVYGKRMIEAQPFPGVLAFFKTILARDIKIHIISHKTKYPYLGPKYDLVEIATQWLEKQGFFSQDGVGLKRENVHFLETKAMKWKKILERECTHFIDDLPEFLLDKHFPMHVKKILFSPEDTAKVNVVDVKPILQKASSWSELKHYFLNITNDVHAI